MKLILYLIFFLFCNKSFSFEINKTDTFKVETNFYNLIIQPFQIENHKKIFITKSKSFYYVTSAKSKSIFKLNYINSKFNLVETLKIPSFIFKHKFNIIHSIESDTKYVYILVSNNHKSKNGCAGVSVWRFNLRDNHKKNIFESTPCLHGSPFFNGNLALKKNKLYVTVTNVFINTGTGQINEQVTKGDTRNNNIYGKINEISLDTGEQRVFSRGLRGLSALFYDFNRNILFNTDNGPRGGDELNIIKLNNNYGWPHETFGIEYSSNDRKLKNIISTNYANPTFVWVPSIAPSSIGVVRGKEFSRYWNNDLIITTLKGRSIRRLRLDKFNRVVYDEPIYLSDRIRSQSFLNDGKIILSTDNGKLLVLSTSSTIPSGNYPPLNKDK